MYNLNDDLFSRTIRASRKRENVGRLDNMYACAGDTIIW